MKSIFLSLTMFIALVGSANAQCDSGQTEKLQKVMSNAFSEDYKKCAVTVTAEFYKNGASEMIKKPKKHKKKIFFQVLVPGEKASSNAFGGVSGISCVIDKKNADLIFSLEQGDMIEMTGTTFKQKFMGTEIGNFFVAESISKIEGRGEN